VDVRQLRCFLAVAEELHFGRAADRLHVAGPAVSQTIRALEKELGLTLFERTNRRVELTAAGRVLVTEAREVIDRLDRAEAAMARIRSEDTGRLRIAAVPALPPLLVPDLLARCAEVAPELNVVVTAASPEWPVSRSLGSGADMVLVRGELDAPGIESTVVAREPVGVALPRNHPLAREPAVRRVQLGGVPLISFPRASDPDAHDRLFGALRGAGAVELRIVHESHPGAVEGSLRLVASGVGVSLKLRSEVEAFGSDDVLWRPLADVQIDVVISAAWRSDQSKPGLDRLVELLEGNLAAAG
jgi:DNA-binding transcriptional LysR family regulator